MAGGGLILSGNNSYTGGTFINSGGIGFNSTSSIPASGAVTVANGAAIGGNAYPSITSWLANLGSFSMSPSAAVAITANSSENIAWPAGTLSLGSIGNNTYSGTLTPSGTTYYLGGGAGTLYMANGALIGANGVVVNGSVGAVAMLGTNTYTGPTTVVGGTLKLANTASALGAGNGETILNGGVLDVSGGTIEGATPYAFTISGTGGAGGRRHREQRQHDRLVGKRHPWRRCDGLRQRQPDRHRLNNKYRRHAQFGGPYADQGRTGHARTQRIELRRRR